MKGYEIQKVETYSVKANSEQEARAMVGELDNGSALRVDYITVWVGQEEEKK